MPVASGLVDSRADKCAAVDLVHFDGTQVRLVELKWESDTPVFAAFEVLGYGLAYLFSWIRREEFGYADLPIMKAATVSLCVLGPESFYLGYDLEWLRRELDAGARGLARRETGGALVMDFALLSFPRDFALPFRTGENVIQGCTESATSPAAQSVIAALGGLKAIYTES